MGRSTFWKIAAAALAVVVVLEMALAAVDLNSPGTFVIGMSASALVFLVALQIAGRKRAAVRTSIQGVNVKAYTLRAEMAEMRRRQADLKAYMVLVPVPETEEQRATLGQLVEALAHQRAIVEARTKDTNAATAELRVAAGIKPLA